MPQRVEELLRHFDMLAATHILSDGGVYDPSRYTLGSRWLKILDQLVRILHTSCLK